MPPSSTDKLEKRRKRRGIIVKTVYDLSKQAEEIIERDVSLKSPTDEICPMRDNY